MKQNMEHAFNLLPRSSCSSCRYKGTHHSSDITVGDFRGCTEQDSYWNPHGVSVLLVHTEKGMSLISSLSELNLTETAYKKAVEKNPMYQAARKRDAKQIQFAEDFADGGLFYACKKSRGIKEKAIGLAEKVLPDGVKKGIRGALKMIGR